MLSTAALGQVSLDAGQGNYVRVENGQVVEFSYAKSLSEVATRSVGDGSTHEDNIFNGQISIIDALNPNSPFSQWIDDLLNPDSDPYVQAVVNALKILLAIMLAALAPLGINNFTILILGFAPGSVQIAYELAVDAAEYSAAGAPDAGVMGAAISDYISNSNNEIEGHTLDNTVTTLSGANGGVISSECPGPCWIVEGGFCIPNPAYLSIQCGVEGQMSISADACIFSDMDISQLTLGGGCDASTANIVDDGSGGIVATTGLNDCSTGMTFTADNVTFSNYVFGENIAFWSERFNVDFSCTYPLSSNTDDMNALVQSFVVSGPTDGTGQFTFAIDFFDDNTFTGYKTGSVRVGTTLYFGVSLATPVPGIEFTVTDCDVYSDLDFQAADTLQYGILTNQCENNRVNFITYTRTDAEMTTFSYTVFEFRTSSATTLHLSCSVRVCDDSATTGTCKDAPNCSSRKRRSSPEEGVVYYQVSKQITVV